MRGSLAIFIPRPTVKTTSTTMSTPRSVDNEQKVETEEITDQRDNQYGMSNIGYVGGITMFPVHVDTLAGGGTIILILFGAVIIWRATRRESIKKVLHLCWPKRQAAVHRARQEAQIEMQTMRRPESASRIPQIPETIGSAQQQGLEDQIRATADRLNLLTWSRNSSGVKPGRLSVQASEIPIAATRLGEMAKKEAVGVPGIQGMDE